MPEPDCIGRGVSRYDGDTFRYRQGDGVRVLNGLQPDMRIPLIVDPAEIVDQMTAIGLNGMSDYLLNFLESALPRVASIVVIVLITFIILRLLRSTVQKLVRRILERQDQPARDLTQKAQTLANVIESTGRFLILLVASMMVLTNLGVEIAPLLASAGIAGLAVGLGAQSLIRDMINGFLILFENQYAVGDVVTIEPVTGTVEELNLRRTILRSINGAAIVIPNGEVKVVENLSKGWSRAIIDVSLAPHVDDEQVMEILHDVFDNIQEDETLGPKIVEPPTVIGLTAMSINQLTYRVMIKTVPLEQWTVERALRRRLRERLIAEGIPFPGTVPGALAEIVEQQG
jgi:moderate conductance mechanosensitive channel